MVIDVPIRITEITRESVAKYFTPDESDKGLSWEWAERQNRLLLMLIKDEEALEQWLLAIAGEDASQLLENDSSRGLPVEVEDSLFERLYSRMDRADARYFAEAKSEGLLVENLELLYGAFETMWKESQLTELMIE
jgi:hypothetical protein